MKKNPFPQDGYKHYYLRNPGRAPIGCVVFKEGTEPGKVIRGITLCSTLDNWDRKEARGKGVGRCRKAEARRRNTDKVNDLTRQSVYEFIRQYGPEFDEGAGIFKSWFNANVTAREARILANDRKYEGKANIGPEPLIVGAAAIAESLAPSKLA